MERDLAFLLAHGPPVSAWISKSGVDTSAPRALSPWRTRIDMETPHTPTAEISLPRTCRLSAHCQLRVTRSLRVRRAEPVAQLRREEPRAAPAPRCDPECRRRRRATAHRPFEIADAESMPKWQVRCLSSSIWPWTTKMGSMRAVADFSSDFQAVR